MCRAACPNPLPGVLAECDPTCGCIDYFYDYGLPELVACEKTGLGDTGYTCGTIPIHATSRSGLASGPGQTYDIGLARANRHYGRATLTHCISVGQNSLLILDLLGASRCTSCGADEHPVLRPQASCTCRARRNPAKLQGSSVEGHLPAPYLATPLYAALDLNPSPDSMPQPQRGYNAA